MITTRIDWGGFCGDVGRVYILGWDEDEYERGRIRVMKTDLVLPTGDCLKIAKAQLDGGHISHPEYLNLTRRLRRNDKVVR